MFLFIINTNKNIIKPTSTPTNKATVIIFINIEKIIETAIKEAREVLTSSLRSRSQKIIAVTAKKVIANVDRASIATGNDNFPITVFQLFSPTNGITSPTVNETKNNKKY